MSLSHETTYCQSTAPYGYDNINLERTFHFRYDQLRERGWWVRGQIIPVRTRRGHLCWHSDLPPSRRHQEPQKSTCLSRPGSLWAKHNHVLWLPPMSRPLVASSLVDWPKDLAQNPLLFWEKGSTSSLSCEVVARSNTLPLQKALRLRLQSSGVLGAGPGYSTAQWTPGLFPRMAAWRKGPKSFPLPVSTLFAILLGSALPFWFRLSHFTCFGQ